MTGEVADIHWWTDRHFSLMINAEMDGFEAGQFARIGLEIGDEFVARQYSYVNPPQQQPLEFYLITVPDGPLTTVLKDIEPGAPIHVSRSGFGLFTLSNVPDGRHLWCLSSGTALGVFLSILRTETPWQRFERVALVHAVRTEEELTYRETVRELEEQYPDRLTYIPFVSREEVASAMPGRVPAAIENGSLEERAGIELNKEFSQTMICGSPEMVRDTSIALEARGFKKNHRRDPGQITIERYW